ncbi:MAG TPA: hypothetical protein VKS24_23905 [Bradyrhizobium sp.]|nr:hypothetical protein [Bradyrhizobium sp.]
MFDTKRTIAVVYLLALATCFFPLVSVSPAALGKTEWSMWDFWSLASGPNPAAWWWLGDDISRLSLTHALLAVGLLLLWLPHYLKVTFICVLLCLRSIGPLLQRHYTISHMLENRAGWHHGTIATSHEAYVLPALLVFLLLVLAIEWNHSAKA